MSASPLEPSAPTIATRDATTSSRRFHRWLALDDFETEARGRLPRMIFGYVDGAVETGSAMRAARQAFDDLAFVPRALVDVSKRDPSRSLFGRRYEMPFGIAPLGGAAMVAYRGDLELAAAAQVADIPMILSATSLIRLEDVCRTNPSLWFQAYLPGDRDRIDPMIERVVAAGIETLVITVDTPVPGNRENNIRNGFSMPLRVTPKVALDSLLHPRWLFGTLGRTFARHGPPHFENMDAVRGPPMLSPALGRNMTGRDQLEWLHVDAIRKTWRGRLVIKGILSAHDARRAREAGVDGIIVSSHGGRQLDHAIAPLLMLAEILSEAKGMSVMLDGGIRRGTDVLKGLALGADFVFLGRPFLYAAALAGQAGVAHAIRLLREEVHRDMALLGLRDLHSLDQDILRPSRRAWHVAEPSTRQPAR